MKLNWNLSVVNQVALTVAIITALVFTGLTLLITKKTADNALTEVERELTQSISMMAGELEFLHSSLMGQTDQLSKVFFDMFSNGQIEIDDSELHQVGQFEVPALKYRGETLNNNFTMPDTFTSMTGGAATVFLRHNDDFLRISTSLEKTDGSRAFGTMLGQTHPGYSHLVNGENYIGPASLFGKKFMTKYTPLKDADGKVIAILFIGFDYTQQLDDLKSRIAEIRFGETGYVYAIDARTGDKQGELVVHPSLEGENLLKMSDADSNTIFNGLLSGDRGILRYLWKRGDESADKITAYQQVKGWGWVVAGGSFVDEFMTEVVELRNVFVAASIICALLVIGLTFVAVRVQLGPLKLIGVLMERIGNGDLTADAEWERLGATADSRNEIRLLAHRTRVMQQSLRELILSVGSSVKTLTEALDGASSVAVQTTDGVKNQEAEIDQVATAINELAATVQEVAKNATSAAEETKLADGKATDGGSVVQSVVASIQALADEVDKSATVIEQLERESESIGTVLEVITGIAEQTNLLALNAAIEAARAGEQGRGFAVVADEVRVLAKKTQNSTTEINDMIQRLQSSSRDAVSAMESGRSKAGTTVGQAGEAGDRLVEISASTSAIADVTVQIAGAAEEQATVVEEINRNVMNIREVASTTAQGAETLSTATSDLQSVAAGLESSIAKFRY